VANLRPPESTSREYAGQDRRDARPVELQVIAYLAARLPAFEPCQNCAIRLPARQALPPFTANVLAERARLAVLDPQGEHEAVVPLDGVKARHVLLHLSEPVPHTFTPAPRTGEPLDERQLLERLGADLSRQSGMVRCPAHEDRAASLSWRWTGERALLHDFGGCTFASVVEALR
jgi:hypothetical protein